MCRALVFRLVSVVLLFSAAVAGAQNIWQPVGNGLATGRLPAWISLDDQITIKSANGRSYGCFTDRATGAKAASWAPTSTLQAFALTGEWRFTTPTPTLYEDQRVCFPELPLHAPMVGAIGQPVYKAIVHTKAATLPYWRNTTPLDFVTMNKDYLVGQTTTGAACGAKLPEVVTGSSDPKIAWHNFGGENVFGMTLCRSP